MIRVVSSRATMLTDLQSEYELLLRNPDCVFIQAEVWINGEITWRHLKGGQGKSPADMMDWLKWNLHTVRFQVIRLHYHYGDRQFRSLEVLKG